MATPINFTKEHKDELMALAGAALVNGTRYRGALGTEMTIYDLFHNCQINTLSKFHASLKKEVSEIENLDEWSLTDYQQQKASSLKNTQKLISLLIGYKRKQAEDTAKRQELKELKNTLAELKESTKTPADRIAEVEAKIAAYGPVEEVVG